jgi:hypothetical protein
VVPERNLARLVSTRYGLAPRVDVEGVARAVVSVEKARFPTSCDCLFIRRPGQRPSLIVSEETAHNANRYRFTIAHELGHLFIPWHGGSIFCHTTHSVIVDDVVTRAFEAEANRFAAELLAPTDWVKAELSRLSGSLARRTILIAEQAGVSPITAMLSAALASPPEHLFVVTDDDRRILYHAVSPDSRLHAPDRGHRLESTVAWISGGAVVSAEQFGPMTLTAISIPGSPIPAVSVQGPSTEILREILSLLPKQRRLAITWSINGIIGSANNPSLQTAQELYESFERRMLGRPDLASIRSHPLFRSFLAAKAMEICERKKGK